MTVATFSDLDKAEAVSARLNRAGIHASVKDETKLQRFWFLSKPLAADKVIVQEKEFERAMQELKTADAQEHLLHGEVRCPECGSAEIEYPQFTRKFMTTTAVEILCLLHVLDRTFYCQHCHHTWPPSRVLRAKTDVLDWPAKDRGVVPQERG